MYNIYTFVRINKNIYIPFIKYIYIYTFIINNNTTIIYFVPSYLIEESLLILLASQFYS